MFEWLKNYWAWRLIAIGIAIVVCIVREKFLENRVTTKKKQE